MKIDSYIKLLRIDHWFKNLFLIVGVLVGIWYSKQSVFDLGLFPKMVLAFLLTSLISSANYIINQITDAEFDSKHQLKKNRPIPSGEARIDVSIILMILLFLVSIVFSFWFYSPSFFVTLISLFIAGILYNIPPIRLKDIPYLDVIAESINNPIRLLLGWFIVVDNIFPPVLILLLAWSAAAILMTAKRFDELLFFGKELTLYRATFKKYSLTNLRLFLYLYSFITTIIFLLIAINYSHKLIWVTPFLSFFLVWLVSEIISGRAKTRSTESFLLSPKFMASVLSFLILLLLFLKS